MTTRTFHYREGNSAKFWSITLNGSTYSVRFGRLGTAGQTQTKAFADDTLARAACERQIAEKLQKGYQEQVDPESSEALLVPAAAPPIAESVTKAPPANHTPPEAVPISTAGSDVRAETGLNLSFVDHLWAPWRGTPAVPIPPVPPFNKAEALRRLAKLPVAQWGWEWNWESLGLGPTPSQEEARFWFAAMTHDRCKLSPADFAAHLAAVDLDAPLSSATIQATARGALFPTPHLVSPLTTLLNREELLALVAGLAPGAPPDLKRGEPFAALLAGFRTYALPYLAPDERARLGRSLAGELNPATWPADPYDVGPPAFYLAAMLGGAEPELARLVESWADDRYRADTWTDYYQRPQLIVFGLGDARAVERHMRRLGLLLKTPEYVRAWLAHTGLAALDLIRDSVLAQQNKAEAAALTEVLAAVVASEVAPVMLELLLHSKAPQVARTWLEAHPEQSIAGLLPVAAGRGRLVDSAADLLRGYVRRGYHGLVEERLAELPPESGARVRVAVLERIAALPPALDETSTPAWLREALAAPPATSAGKASSWLRTVDLPTVIVGEHRLSDRHVESLLRALQRSTLETPHPLAVAVRAHAEPGSRDAFAWALCEQWLAEGAPSKEKWAFTAVGLLGGDPSALKLAPLVRAWPGESQHQRAVLGLEVLRAIGSDTALMQINGIAQKVKFKGLQERAAACMEQIARQRGLSRAQLEDRVVPDCDLDARGERSFDFGPRRFRFVLGPDLKPMLRDEQGAVRADLPKPNAKDDPALAAQAAADWKLLKKQVAEVARIQAVRLEQAMVTSRRWTPDEFTSLIVRHPLLTHLARTLLWGAYEADNTLRTTFRVTEDQSLADSADAPLALPEGCTVGIVHPLQLGEAEVGAWGELLSDYEITPAFPQLGRQTYRLDEAERAATEVMRFGGRALPAATLVFGLDKLGWTRDAPADGGGFCGHFKPFPQAGVTAVVQYRDGVAVGWIVDAPEQQIDYLAFVPGVRTPQMWPNHADRLPLAAIDPMVMSEVLGDLTQIVMKL